MRLDELQQGKRIEYTFTSVSKDTLSDGAEIEQGIMHFATTPVMYSKKELNTKLDELEKRSDVVSITVMDVSHWTKPTNETQND